MRTKREDTFGISDIVTKEISSEKKARLILIKPRDIMDQVKRPYNYDFSNRYLNKIDELIGTDIPEFVSCEKIVNSKFRASDIGSAIVYDNGVETLKTSDLSYNWAFILIVDNDTGRGRCHYLRSRKVIYGYVVGDDAAIKGRNGGWIINENARIVFTNTMNYTSNANAMNTAVAPSSFMRIGQGRLADELNLSNEICVCTPVTAYQGSGPIEFADDDTGTFKKGICSFTTVSDATLKSSNDDIACFGSNASMGLELLKETARGCIVSAKTNAEEEAYGDMFSSGMIEPQNSPVDAWESGDVYSKHSYVNGRIDMGDIFTFGDLGREYDLDFVVNNHNDYGRIADNIEEGLGNGIANIMASFISDNLPTCLYESSLQLIQLRYDSNGDYRNNPNSEKSDYLPGCFEVFTAKALSGVDGRMAVKNFMKLYAKYIHQYVGLNGDYNVFISCGIGDSTNINLVMNEVGDCTDGTFIKDETFGLLTDPLVCSKEQFVDNANQMATLNYSLKSSERDYITEQQIGRSRESLEEDDRINDYGQYTEDTSSNRNFDSIFNDI